MSVAVSMEGLALDWSEPRPRLVPYLGRIEREGEAEPEALILADGSHRVLVPHSAVFWLGGVCRGVARCHLSPSYGMA